MLARRLESAVLVTLAGLAVVLLLFATRPGLGVGPDSTTYLDAARHLRQGEGLVVLEGSHGTRPLSHYPPLYPALLALAGTASADALAGARALHALLFGVNVLLVGLLIRRATD